eukprot:5695730-Lingulodinium_polyedra.AAC.1
MTRPVRRCGLITCQRSACFHSACSAPSRRRTTPSRTYLLSVKSTTSPATAVIAARAAKSSPLCAVCWPWTGSAQARPPGPVAATAHAARASSGPS